MIITKILAGLSQQHNHNVDYDHLLPVFPMGDSIPHTIMQTCKSLNDLPKDILCNIESIKELNKGWEYRIFDNSQIEGWIERNYGNAILDYYKRITPSYGAAKADLFRYLFIYKEGGVYLDIKSSISKSLEDNLKDNDAFILSYWDNLEGEGHYNVGHYSDIFNGYPRGEIPQWFIISAAGHPIIRDVILQVLKNIDNYNPYVNGVGWTGTVFTTGPVPYSLTIYSNLRNYPHRLVNIFTDFGFVYSIYEHTHSDKSFHATAIKSDYRKGVEPLIKSKCSILHNVNKLYLRILNRHRGR